jgi:tellurite resistance protein
MKKPTKKAATKTKAKKPAVRRPIAAKKKPARKAAATRTRTRTGGRGETLLCALTLAMVSDGEIAPSEIGILLRFAKEPLFKGVDAKRVIEETIRRCIDQGPDLMFDEIGKTLTTKDDRETAFLACLAVTATDGKLTASEVRMLHVLRDALEISNARAKKLAGPVAAIFG